jgi:hypothetical protein
MSAPTLARRFVIRRCVIFCRSCQKWTAWTTGLVSSGAPMGDVASVVGVCQHCHLPRKGRGLVVKVLLRKVAVKAA